MFRTISASFLLLFIAFSSQAQEKKQRVKRPDFPGAFLIEFGFNRAQGSTPDNFEQGFWGSRTLNLYDQYPIRFRDRHPRHLCQHQLEQHHQVYSSRSQHRSRIRGHGDATDDECAVCHKKQRIQQNQECWIACLF